MKINKNYKTLVILTLLVIAHSYDLSALGNLENNRETRNKITRTNAGDDDFSSGEYQKLSATEKMTKLWVKISADKTSLKWYNSFQIGGIFLENLSKTFDIKQTFFQKVEKS